MSDTDTKYASPKALIDAVDELISSSRMINSAWFVESYKENVPYAHAVYKDEEGNRFMPIFAVQVNIGTKLYRDPLDGYGADFEDDDDFDDYVDERTADLEEFSLEDVLWRLGENIFLEGEKPVIQTVVEDPKEGHVVIIEKPCKLVYCLGYTIEEGEY